MKVRLSQAAVVAFLCLLLPSFKTNAAAPGDYVYNNLQKSRDALLDQKRELQRAYDDTSKQMDLLNQKLTRIDAYMKQVDKAIRDVDDALRGR